jgi:hypothetical protein
MLQLPPRFATTILSFAPLFFQRSWRHAEMLVLGAILTPGTRTVTRLLRITGLAQERHFVNYHRVLNRAVWSPRAAGGLLLHLLLAAFAPRGPVVLGLDDTIERRRGACIAAKGIYRDPVRSSHGHFVKASGLRWLSLMLLAPVPWAGRIWALPFLTALAPSARYHQTQGRRHKKLTDWGRQMVLQARRWLPGRAIVLVTDSSFAAIEFLAALCCYDITCITRLRLDAALYAPAPPRPLGAKGRPRKSGARLPNLSEVLTDTKTVWQRATIPQWYGESTRCIELTTGTAVWRHSGMPVVPIRWVLVRDPLGRFTPQALLCTALETSPEQVLRWFVQRWQLEVTFAETRAHLGIETQRQWSDCAIARTTPCLLGLFSLVTLLATRLPPSQRRTIATSAWYRKGQPTFSDTLALVRRHIWRQQGFLMSRCSRDRRKPKPALQKAIIYALCHAA